LRQTNLFIGRLRQIADDGEVIEFSQRGFERMGSAAPRCELGGTGTGPPDTWSPSLIRMACTATGEGDGAWRTTPARSTPLLLQHRVSQLNAATPTLAGQPAL
jgi:hypothetical protein